MRPSKMYVHRKELEKSALEVMAEMSAFDHEYQASAKWYLEASKEAKTQKDTIRLFNLSQEMLRKDYLFQRLA